jgi:hypothetical protein
MQRNRPPQDQAVSNQSTSNVLSAGIVQARNALRTRDVLDFSEPNFNVRANGIQVLAGNLAGLTVPTNLRTGKTLTANSLLVTGDANVGGNLSVESLSTPAIAVENATFGNLVVQNQLVSHNVATAETLTANTLSVTSGGTAMLYALTVVPPLYLCPGDNATVTWRIAVNDLTGNLEFQVSPNWESRLSVSPSGP